MENMERLEMSAILNEKEKTSSLQHKQNEQIQKLRKNYTKFNVPCKLLYHSNF